MAEKEKVINEQERKLRNYRQRRKTLCFYLFIELIIVWILNPEFIPGLSTWAAAVQSFFVDLLWPHDMAELDAGTYRSYIYYFCTWLEGLDLYPLLAWAAPRIVPVWLVVTDIQSCAARSRIRKAKKPPKEKKQHQPKQPKAQKEAPLSVGPKVSGLYTGNSLNVERRFKLLQESCTPLQESSAAQADRGLWVCHQARGAGGKIPPDRIYTWDDQSKIEINCTNNILKFVLYADGPQLRAHDGTVVSLQKGVPLTITHNNEADEEIIDMTITWLGGIE